MNERTNAAATVNDSRVDFASANADQFHALRDRWLEAAQGTKLPKAAYQVAALLPTYINREHGYAWPTDLDLAEIMGKTVKTVVRAMKALDEAGLIDRETRVKRDENREAVGRERRIFLTLPEVKGHRVGEVKGHAKGERTFGGGERTTVVHINLTQNHPMKKFRDKGTTREEGVHSPLRVPSPFTDDHDFIDAFDREVVRAGKGGDDTDLAAAAFNAATDSAAQFMPFHWESLCRLRGGDAKGWFIARAGQLRVAA